MIQEGFQITALGMIGVFIVFILFYFSIKLMLGLSSKPKKKEEAPVTETTAKAPAAKPEAASQPAQQAVGENKADGKYAKVAMITAACFAKDELKGDVRVVSLKRIQ